MYKRQVSPVVTNVGLGGTSSGSIWYPVNGSQAGNILRNVSSLLVENRVTSSIRVVTLNNLSVNGVTYNESVHFSYNGSVYSPLNNTYNEIVDHSAGTVSFQGELSDGMIGTYVLAGSPILHDANIMKYLLSGDKWVWTEDGEQLFLNNENDGVATNNVYKLINGLYNRVSLGTHDASLISPSTESAIFDMFIPELNKTGKAIYDTISQTRKHLVQLTANDSFTFNKYLESNYVDVVTKTDTRLYTDYQLTNTELAALFPNENVGPSNGKIFLLTPSSAATLNDNDVTLQVDLTDLNHGLVGKVQVKIANNDQLGGVNDKYLSIVTANTSIYRIINTNTIETTTYATSGNPGRKEFALSNLETVPSFNIVLTDGEGISETINDTKSLPFLIGSDVDNAVPLLGSTGSKY